MATHSIADPPEIFFDSHSTTLFSKNMSTPSELSVSSPDKSKLSHWWFTSYLVLLVSLKRTFFYVQYCLQFSTVTVKQKEFNQSRLLFTMMSCLCSLCLFLLTTFAVLLHSRCIELDRSVSTEMLLHAFITCRLDQCNSLLYGLQESQITKL